MGRLLLLGIFNIFSALFYIVHIKVNKKKNGIYSFIVDTVSIAFFFKDLNF